ncbi:head-tail adaptor protein [Pseudoroseicyclus aestuarii]|uniref:Head-tail adaptor n=1 Tax=Pseudoroseicyclus aestuarii TaxID=1795041 RepID=A0A318SZ82_9RHOB|nr:head-tail adaptor protein [Pseudoroseicyclus aestuarii]PYE85716.1 head-tail adaptor [Pseudoroseicyclus aestuarii]
MRVPRLNRALVLEAPQRSPDGAGGWITQWQALGTLWAEIDARSGRAGAAAAGDEVSLTRVRITLRGAPMGSPRRPMPEQRLRGAGRVFRVLAVREADPEGRYLVLDTEVEVAR